MIEGQSPEGFRPNSSPDIQTAALESSPEHAPEILLQAVNAERVDNQVHILTLREAAELYGGGLAPKRIVSGELDGRHVSLIERRNETRYEENWLAMRKAGLPVVPDLWRGDEHTLYVTDVKADGSEVYGKGFFVITSSGEPERDRPEVNSIYQHLRTTSRADIEAEARRVADQASSAGIALPWDDALELVVSPNGTWRLMILDTNGASIGIDDEASLREQNAQGVNTFLRTLNEIDTLLAAPTDPPVVQ